MNFKVIIQKFKDQAKQLTVGISQIEEGKSKEELYGDSIDLLLSIKILDSLYNVKLERILESSSHNKR